MHGHLGSIHNSQMRAVADARSCSCAQVPCLGMHGTWKQNVVLPPVALLPQLLLAKAPATPPPLALWHALGMARRPGAHAEDTAPAVPCTEGIARAAGPWPMLDWGAGMAACIRGVLAEAMGLLLQLLLLLLLLSLWGAVAREGLAGGTGMLLPPLLWREAGARAGLAGRPEIQLLPSRMSKGMPPDPSTWKKGWLQRVGLENCQRIWKTS